MTTLSDRTHVKFSVPQFCTIIVALVGCTWTVNNTINGLRDDLRTVRTELADETRLSWKREDQNKWVWLANRNNPKFTLPYPVELQVIP